MKNSENDDATIEGGKKVVFYYTTYQSVPCTWYVRTYVDVSYIQAAFMQGDNDEDDDDVCLKVLNDTQYLPTCTYIPHVMLSVLHALARTYVRMRTRPYNR